MSTDKQAENKGRDDKGRFQKGHALGFQPGESGNPAGRPKSITLSEAYRKQLAKPVPNDPEGRTFAEVIAQRLCLEAATGEVRAAVEIADRVEGKARQRVDMNMNVRDWRELAAEHGLSEEEVLMEARLLVQSSNEPSGL